MGCRLEDGWFAFNFPKGTFKEDTHTKEELDELGEDLSGDVVLEEEVCSCFPEHCHNEEHYNETGIFCWCDPGVVELKTGNCVIVHRQES